jgi:hypothetical protein
VNAAKADMSTDFKLKDLGPATKVVGIEIRRDRQAGTIHISQRAYLEELLEEFNMVQCKALPTPQDASVKLSKDMAPQTAEERAKMREVPYRRVVAKLLFASVMTRPDIAHAVSMVCRYQLDPGLAHWRAVKHILRYLKGTLNLGIMYGQGDAVVRGWSDADWAGDVDGRRSTSGYVFTYGGGAITWSSRRQASVAVSTMEAEYMALYEATKEAVWLQRLVGDISGATPPFVEISEDNQSCIQYGENPKFHGRAKHVDTKYHFVREHLATGRIKLRWCPSDKMVADALTKGLARDAFARQVEAMGMC